MTKKKAKKSGLYYTLPPDDREKEVRRLMEAGGSNISVAKALGTKPNSIASYRNRKGIPSTHDAPSMGKSAPQKPPPAPHPSTPSIKPMPQDKPRLKLAAAEATQCVARDEDGRRCGYERHPGSEYCGLPQHQKLKTKARRE